MIWPLRQALPPRLPPVLLEDKRVLVRPPLLEDWPRWKEVRGRNESYLKPYEPTWPEDCLSRGFFVRRLRQQARDWMHGRGHAFLVFEKQAGALIGGVNINSVCRGASQYATLGYWLDEKLQGNGYMAEALELVITFGFKKLNLHRFNAGCLVDNERSANLLLKLGFEEEGFARKYVKINGEWQDHRLFGLPVEQWTLAQQDNDPAENTEKNA